MIVLPKCTVKRKEGTKMSFKKDFVWGAATASYQIEGAALEDGKGLSVWDVLSHKDGFVLDNNNGDVACDHYHRFREDVQLMKKMGLKAYRFSISWPRVLPEGIGRVNEKGLDFYDKLVDELVANGIEPYVTLFHWDYPNALFMRGGFLNPDSPDWFAEYAKVIVDRLSDRVTHWMTLNEPQCHATLGYIVGTHAPGLKMDHAYTMQLIHNMLLSHGKAVQVIRSYAKKTPIIGYAPVLGYVAPKTNSKEDIALAKQYMFSCQPEEFGFSEPWWNKPIYEGAYPEDGLKLYEQWLPKIGQNDMNIIHQPLDFFGFNFYRSETTAGYVKGEPKVSVDHEIGLPLTAFDWEITPDAFCHVAKALYEKYRLPLLITENGLANQDWVSLDGKVHDPQRIDFLQRYLRALKQAAEEGADIMGYMHWSLMDNFEWAAGYQKRFGMIYVNYQTQERILKDSAYWYQKVIASNGEIL